MSTDDKSDLVNKIAELSLQARKAFQAVAGPDLAKKIAYDEILRQINKTAQLMAAPGLLRQPDPTPDPVVAEAPPVAVPVKTAQAAVAIARSNGVPKIDIPAMKRSVDDFVNLRKLLASFIKDDDKTIVSVNTPAIEEQEIFNNFTSKTAKLLLSFSTNTTAWLLVLSPEGIYSVSDSKFWKIDQ